MDARHFAGWSELARRLGQRGLEPGEYAFQDTAHFREQLSTWRAQNALGIVGNMRCGIAAGLKDVIVEPSFPNFPLIIWQVAKSAQAMQQRIIRPR